MKTNKPKSWEKEFDKKFVETSYDWWLTYYDRNGTEIDAIKPTDVKHFISQLLKEERTRIIKIVEDMEVNDSDGWENAKEESCCPGDDWADGYESALKDILKEIKGDD